MSDSLGPSDANGEGQVGQDLGPESPCIPDDDVVAPEFDTLIKGIEGAFPKDGGKPSEKG